MAKETLFGLSVFFFISFIDEPFYHATKLITHSQLSNVRPLWLDRLMMLKLGLVDKRIVNQDELFSFNLRQKS